MEREVATSSEHRHVTFSLESALEAAQPGATIDIPAGEYYAKPGGWLITKSITLLGQATAGGALGVTVLTKGAPAFVIAPGTTDVIVMSVSFADCSPPA